MLMFLINTLVFIKHFIFILTLHINTPNVQTMRDEHQTIPNCQISLTEHEPYPYVIKLKSIKEI